MGDDTSTAGRVAQLQESPPSLFQGEPRLLAWPPPTGAVRVDPNRVVLRRELLQALPGPLLRLHRALAIDLHQETLILGMEDPGDLAVQETVRRLTGWEVLAVQLCPEGGPLPSWNDLQNQRREQGQSEPFKLEQTQLEVSVVGCLSWVRLVQIFRNTSSAPAEGLYQVPIPHSAVQQGFWSDCQGRLLTSGTTQRSVQGGRLHLATRIGPVEGGQRLTLTLAYVHSLDRDVQGFRLQLPCPVGESPYQAVLKFEVEGLEPEQISCTRPATWHRLPSGELQVQLKNEGHRATQDLVLHYRVAERELEANLFSDGQHYLLQLRPAPLPGPPAPRDIVFLLDRSASLEGWTAEQGRRAVLHCLRRLRPLDRFSLAIFDHQVVAWQDGRRVGSGALSAAKNWLQYQAHGGGTTDLVGALEWLLDHARRNQFERPLFAVLISDGQGGRQGEACRVASALRGSLRLFTLGIGPHCEEHFLGRLAMLAGGSSETAASSLDLPAAMERLCQQIGTPALSQVRLVGQGFHLDPAQQHPARLPDLFPGQNFTVLGRHQGGGPLLATGISPEGPISVLLNPVITDHAALATLWARAQLEGLQRKLGQVHPEQRNAVVEQMHKLRLGYQLDRSLTEKMLSPEGWMRPRQPEHSNGLALTEALLEQAVLREASHIHVETQSDQVKVRLRICGRLQTYHGPFDLSQPWGEVLIGQFKQRCRLNSARGHFQTGRFQSEWLGRAYSFEASFCPTVSGEKVVLEVRPAQVRNHAILAEPARSAVEKLLARRRGLLLICGPKGSGGNSLMVDWLSSFLADRHCVFCHKEEWFGLSGVTQMCLRPDQAGLLGDLEGQDIDVLACTRTREREAWEALLRRSSERSLVLARHHARNASAALVELVEQGLDGRALGKALLGAICLCRLPRLCQCRVEETDPQVREALEGGFRAGPGCPRCHGSGFVGSLIAAEMLLYRPDILTVLRPGVTPAQVEHALIRFPLEHQVRRLAQQGLVEARHYLSPGNTF